MRAGPDAAPRTGVELMEESASLLHHAPARLLAAYFAGSAPFAMGLLYFTARLSRGLSDNGFVAAGSLALALLFLWMKCWHAVFASGLSRHLMQEPPQPWTLRRVLRLVATQTVLQPSGLLAIPLSFFFLVPFGRIHAYYQNLAVLGDGRQEVEDVRRRAWELSRPWPRQNLAGMWAFSPWFFLAGVGSFALFAWGLSDYLSGDSTYVTVLLMVYGFFLFAGIFSPLSTLLAINVAVLLLAGPYLLDRWFGIRTAFTMAGVFSIVNSTFLLAVSSIALLLLDPFMKGFYVLRCFYAGSRTSGEDLRMEWRMRDRARTGATAVLLLLLLGGPAIPSSAAEPAAGAPTAGLAAEAAGGEADAGALDAAIERVINRPEYRWRMPPPPPDGEEDAGAVPSFLRSVRDWLRDIVRRLEDWFIKRDARDGAMLGSPSGGRTVNATTVLIVLAVALIILAVVLAIRSRRAARAGDVSATVVTAAPVRPDITDERVRADQLPSDEWIAMSRELRARGEWRPAVRALFLSQLAWLAQQQLVRIAPGRSNRDYVRDLLRRRQTLAELPDRFLDNVGVFERVWYGRDRADEVLLDVFEDACRRMRGGGHA